MVKPAGCCLEGLLIIEPIDTVGAHGYVIFGFPLLAERSWDLLC